MEAFAQGVTGAKAALYQILYLQTPVTDLSWHQDHDHFFLTEYNRTHLNYWIPLVKPSRTEAAILGERWLTACRGCLAAATPPSGGEGSRQTDPAGTRSGFRVGIG